MAPLDRVVIGVDFGTTFTGVAAVYSGTPDELEIIKTWPGGNGITSDKVPTEFSYDVKPDRLKPVKAGQTPRLLSDSVIDQFQSMGVNPSTTRLPVKWGFQVKPGETRINCIKLFLDRGLTLPSFVSTMGVTEQLRVAGRSPADAVTDFLSCIYDHTVQHLKKRFGETFMKSTHVQFVLTCPAVWSDTAKAVTLRAAAQAGMGADLRLISEPEAAAVYTLKSIQPNHLHIGDNMIVCDAGGGTVDLISYKITKLDPLEVEESQVGTGGLCGGVFLNFRFEDHVKSRIGEAKFLAMKEKKPKSWHTGLKFFEEYVKRNFSEEEELEEFNVPFPGLEDDEKAGVDSGFLVMTAEQVKEIFEPIVKEIIELIEGQVTRIHASSGLVAAIILVGGFGQSSYLHTRIQAYFETNHPPPYSASPSAASGPNSGKIEVMQPANAWTAICRGAVMRGLQGRMVTERRTRYHYGTRCDLYYDPDKHPASSKYWNSLVEDWFAARGMKWYLAKNELVSEERAIAFLFYRRYQGSDLPAASSLKYTISLVACKDDVAPVMYSGRFLDVCTLHVDLSSVPTHCFARRVTSTGTVFHELSYILEMRIDSASMTFGLKIDGHSYGKVSATYD